MEPLYYGHFGTSIQRSLNTLQYYTGTQNGVLIIEVSAIQRFVVERSHCKTDEVNRPMQLKGRQIQDEFPEIHESHKK